MTDVPSPVATTLAQGWVAERARLISETIDGETIVIDTISGAYFSLDLVASHVWAIVEQGPVDPSMIVDGITSLWPDDGDRVRRDVLELLATLAANMLIVAAPDPVPSVAAAPLTTPLPPYASPTVAKYTDMEELLLIDPIHDVDPNSGWPVARADGDR